MKQVTVFLFAFSFTALLKAQTTLTPNQQAVKQTITNMFDALSARDSVRLKLYCTNDITLYEYGMVWNMDTLIHKAITINTAGDFKRVNTFDFSSITVDKKTAWATYRLHSEINSDGKLRSLQWIETVILVKDKKRWKIKLLHSTLTKKN
jgi:ketosteroid isomerase-like protein